MKSGTGCDDFAELCNELGRDSEDFLMNLCTFQLSQILSDHSFNLQLR